MCGGENVCLEGSEWARGARVVVGMVGVVEDCGGIGISGGSWGEEEGTEAAEARRPHGGLINGRSVVCKIGVLLVLMLEDVLARHLSRRSVRLTWSFGLGETGEACAPPRRAAPAWARGYQVRVQYSSTIVQHSDRSEVLLRVGTRTFSCTLQQGT